MTPKAKEAARARSIRYAYANRARKLAAGLCGVCNRPRDKSPYYCVECTITMRRRRRKDPHYYVELLPNGLYAAVLKGRNGLPDRIESVHEREQEADQAALDYRKDWDEYHRDV